MIRIARAPVCAALVTAILFLIVAIPLSGVLPLWLDEILQLIDTRQPSTAELISRLPRHSGQGQGPGEQFIQVYRDSGLTNTPLTFGDFDYPINF